MTITFEVHKQMDDGVTAVVVPATAGTPIGHGLDETYLRACGFEGRLDQVATVPGPVEGSVKVVIGLGKTDEVDDQALRRAGAIAARATARHATVGLHLLDALPTATEAAERADAAQALAEGFTLGGYQFARYKSTSEPPAHERVVVAGPGTKGLGKRGRQALDRGVLVAAGVAFARDLVNEPGGSLTPAALADAAVEMAEREGLEVTVFDEKELARRGMGGLLGVNRGSAQPPRFIRLDYVPANARGRLALVGKGITFDSGGLSIKTAQGMMTMKDDMGGAAAILGAFSAMRAVAPRCRVTGYLPATDNMTGPDATRPGDVLRLYGGKTVEVLNTDAEGRLVLGDALALASEDRPDAIVDLATLTGAAITALGNRVSAMYANHRGWRDQVLDAADRAGERLWELPLVDEYRKRLDSDVADLRNIAKTPDGGSITAALFLREFVGAGIPWAHLDIAGPAWSDETDGEVTKGGTGWGVRTLLELARGFRKPR